MYLEAIEHVMNSVYAHAIAENTVVIRLRAKRGDLKECILFYGNRCYPVEPVIMDSIAMKCVASSKLFDYFEAVLTTKYNRICYYFWLNDGIKSTYYYGNDFYDHIDEQRVKYFQLPYIRREEIVDVPMWVKEAIVYQIFPDSFATSHRYISGQERSLENQFGDRSYGKNGGTLQGILDNLPYLQELGITCLYLNPIFTAPSCHKYDTQDYFSIDPCFGDKETLQELVRRSHERGIRVILDGVFNHCGVNFFAFKDLLEKGVKSRYKDWFYQVQFPLFVEDKPNYACFAYAKNMPKLNTGHPEVRDYLIKVGTYWIQEADIDGWRLDVADEVDHYFWKCFRKAVKSLKPDAFLLGEIWGDAQPWLEGDEFDSTMNYRFADICREYFAERKISTADFDAKVHQLRMRYRKNLSYAQLNLLDSHDVPRFLHWCRGDIRRLKLAVLFQMMAEGVPSIYYGDEKGISGFQESECRRPMVWEDSEITADLLNYYKKIIAIRKKFKLAMLGDYKTVITDCTQNVYGFTRQRDEEKLLVLLNNSENDCEIEVPVNGNERLMIDLMNEREYQVMKQSLKLTLPGMGGSILCGT